MLWTIGGGILIVALIFKLRSKKDVIAESNTFFRSLDDKR